MTDTPKSDLDTGTIFRERWTLHWDPGIEPALVELNLYGDSVESAALSKLQEDLARDEMHAGRTCQRLLWAVDMNLPEMITQVEAACGTAIDNDGRFVSLSHALVHLNVIDRYALHRHLRRSLLADLIVRCFDRACFSIVEVANVPEQEQDSVVRALYSLSEIVLREDQAGLDRDLFAEHVRAAAEESNVPFLRGAFLGVLSELRILSPEELAAEVAHYAQASADRMIEAGDFLEGVMTVSRSSILLGAGPLVRSIDELLRAAGWDSFLTMIPRMRAAFERLHERQRDSLAARVAEHYGLEESESLRELTTSVEAGALLARIDAQVAEIMSKWDL